MSARVVTGAITVVTHFPSPYQVELFNEVERQRPGALRLFFLFRNASARRWSPLDASFPATFLEDPGAMARARSEIANTSFAVLNYYNDRRAAALIRARAASGLPWCFWGERPGYRYPMLARLVRRQRLSPLRHAPHPIWGIGGWAVDEYRREFGAGRSYVNLPYFSDLTRFDASPARFSDSFTFLFSGALVRRKGIDVLAHAFLALADEQPHVRLSIMGEGPMEQQTRRMLARSQRVSWIGFKDWAHLPAVYASAQALCVPSRHDGWGLVVPEGLAAALPVIATTRTGAARDLIAPGRNGWLVPDSDPDALFLAMREAALLGEARWREMSLAARASVRGHSLSAGAARFLQAVDEGVTAAMGD